MSLFNSLWASSGGSSWSLEGWNEINESSVLNELRTNTRNNQTRSSNMSAPIRLQVEMLIKMKCYWIAAGQTTLEMCCCQNVH